jgi:hypothetical protein
MANHLARIIKKIGPVLRKRTGIWSIFGGVANQRGRREVEFGLVFLYHYTLSRKGRGKVRCRPALI